MKRVPDSASRDRATPAPAVKRTRLLKWTEFVPLVFGGGGVADEDTVVVCLYSKPWSRPGENDASAVPEQVVLEARVREALGPSVGVVWADSYAGACVKLARKDLDKAYPLMTLVLEAGYNILSQTRMCVSVTASDFARTTTPLTPASLERLHIAQLCDMLNDTPALIASIWTSERPYRYPGSWCTDEGRELVPYLYRLYLGQGTPQTSASASTQETPYEPSSDEEEVPLAFPRHPVPAPDATDALTASTPVDDPASSALVVVVSDDEEGGDEPAQDARVRCVCCLDKPADTLVLPCMHSVACRACSQKLRDTPNRVRCIVCRARITQVLEDGRT